MAKRKPKFVATDRSKCPTPEKLYFGSKLKAKNWIKRKSRNEHTQANKIYRCCCGYWHTTRRPSRDFAVSRRMEKQQ